MIEQDCMNSENIMQLENAINKHRLLQHYDILKYPYDISRSLVFYILWLYPQE